MAIHCAISLWCTRAGTTLHNEQKRLYCTYTEAAFINKPNEPDFYRLGVPYQQKLFEITGLVIPANKPFSKDDLLDALDGNTLKGIIAAAEIAFEAAPDLSKVQKRLVQFAKTTFYDAGLSSELTEGDIAHHGLPFKAWEAAYTDAQLLAWFGTKLPANAMTDGGFVLENGHWWRPSGKVIFDAAQFYQPVQQIDLFGQTVTLEYDTYRLLPKRSFTVIHNVTLETSAEFDYRTLQPKLLTDPNGNRSEAITDALGMVIATAVMGKTTETKGDTLTGYIRRSLPETADHRAAILASPLTYLQGASTFFYYDLHAWYRNKQQPFALSIARREHHADNTAPLVQMAVGYSDGFGRQLLTKVQAESGKALYWDATAQAVQESASGPRWVGNGRTIFNNKGKPVKQYEPYFSTNWDYEDETALREYGVTPVQHYDAAGRVIRTDMPDGTFTKVEFTPWEQRTFDQNDTVLDSQWYIDRGSPDPAGPEPNGNNYPKRAAFWAALHANTPKTEYFDTLGRVFLLRDHNRNFTPVNVNATHYTYTAADEYIDTRFELDIEGNQRSVTDALGRLITVNTFNLTGEPVHTHSMDGGQRWMLTNALGNPIFAWNERGFATRFTYDALQRPLATYVSENGGPEKCVQFTFYGERAGGAANLNLLGQAHFHYDASGLTIAESFDFKGNPLETSRLIAKAYQQVPDWSALAGLANPTPSTLLQAGLAQNLFESGIYLFETQYDALSRPIRQSTPDQSQTEYQYNDAGLLERVQTRLRSAQR